MVSNDVGIGVPFVIKFFLICFVFWMHKFWFVFGLFAWDQGCSTVTSFLRGFMVILCQARGVSSEWYKTMHSNKAEVQNQIQTGLCLTTCQGLQSCILWEILCNPLSKKHLDVSLMCARRGRRKGSSFWYFNWSSSLMAVYIAWAAAQSDELKPEFYFINN